MRLHAAAVVFVSSLALPAAAQTGRFDFDSTPGRLPKTVVPHHYQLDFELDPERDAFVARARIDVTLRQPIDSITLQARDLTPRSAHLVAPTGERRDAVVTADAATTTWRLVAPVAPALEPGAWRIEIDYEGKIERRGNGLFRVDYNTGAGDSRRMLATQMEPTYARSVFPGFDEPAFRATFDVAIIAPAGFEAVSNMPVTQRRPRADGRVRTEFARTPAMPTYLLALAVGEFEALEDSQDGVALRILTARGRSAEGQYAMQVTKTLLRYFGEYFGRPYMLPKLDQLAIPGVRGGAMEDWGAISYNENLLLFDPARSPPRQKETVFHLVAHEIAHQWFGNLVTMGWWNDLWLNEAFASWMATKAQHHFNPAWSVDVRARLFREEALALDARPGTRAVADPPAHESAISDLFDDITYDKGGAVLGMFEAQLGPEVFRDGLRRYMSAHQYGNATAADLWFHLSQAAGRDLAPMVATWLRQPGFPLLTVQTRCTGGTTHVHLAQERFTAQRADQVAALWQVPVVVRGGTASRRLILGQQPQQLDFAGCVPVIANGGDTGYYRVQYDRGNRTRLRAAYLKLPPTERIGLIADAMALARAGRAEFDAYFDLLKAAQAETHGAVWQQVIEHLTQLDDLLAGDPTQQHLRTQSARLLGRQLQRIGWRPQPADDSTTLRLRASLIDALGRFEHAATVERATAEFNGWLADPGRSIDASIRAGVVRTTARHADQTTFEAIRRLLKSAANQEDNYLYGGAMVLVRDPRLVMRVLELSLTDEWAPGAATWYARQIGPSSGHAQLAADFIVRHFAQLHDKASRNGRRWLLPDAYSGFSEVGRADELLRLQEQLLGAEALGPAQRTSELIREKAAVRPRAAAAVERWQVARPSGDEVSAVR